ncbi:MAG: MBOAT family O-acyltransferase [Bacteroidota bacterium]|jgi:alginate O-acetyltransferase complex protein AlgI
MAFSSSIFLVYFLPAFLIPLFLLDRKFRNYWILIASIFFYMWGAPKFVFVLLGSVLIDFYLVRWMSEREGDARKLLFWLSLLLNLGLLLYFKYMNFFVEQFGALSGHSGGNPSHWVKIALPVGISFITFQKLSYTLDVYKKQFSPFKKLEYYAMYILMFPQLLSGPIVRPKQIAAQIEGIGRSESIDDRLTGFMRFAIGLAKKVLIADVLGEQVNAIFAMDSAHLSSGLAWIGAIAYTFQIYFDFSGYTDMAIGIARMMGFRLPENFNSPYVSGSITEFWKRWHMTLGSWFRDYVFLPLAYATSRKMPKEKYLGIRADKVIYLIATSVTFLLCGFWHGAAWTFILWGVYQGIFLILDRLVLLKYFKKAGRAASVAITFFITVFGWVLFRSDSLASFRFYLHRMVAFRGGDNDLWLNPKFWTVMVIAVIFSFIGYSKKVEAWQNRLFDKPGNAIIIGFMLLALLLFVISLASITSTGFSPFIYFRF